MPIIYSFVAKADGTVLAEYAPHKGNTAQVAADCMQHVTSSADPRMTITCDGWVHAPKGALPALPQSTTTAGRARRTRGLAARGRGRPLGRTAAAAGTR
jgi:hypothetical protein